MARRTRGTGSLRNSQTDVPTRRKLTAVAGFMATPSPIPRFSSSMSSHQPSRVATPIRTMAVATPCVSERLAIVLIVLRRTRAGELLRAVARRHRVVGMDVVEIAPGFDSANAATCVTAGRLILNVLLGSFQQPA